MRICNLCLISALFLISACEFTEPELLKENRVFPNASQNISMTNLDADLIVTTTNDIFDLYWSGSEWVYPGGDGVLSLREAIFLSNELPGRQKIAFNIPTTDIGFNNGVFTIYPNGGWNHIEGDGLTIDGSTQTQFTGNTNPSGPEIVIDGSQMQPGTIFRIYSSYNHIHSLVINNLKCPGIMISGNGIKGNKITGCYIGTDPTGTIALPNNWIGIQITGQNSSEHIIGGPNEFERNVISGNLNDGIQIHYGVTNCLIQGNYIGTDATGTKALGNQGSGISLITSLEQPTGEMKIYDNLISGNGLDGINITSQCLVKRNLIGTDKYGNAGLGNHGNGIRYSSSFNGEPSVGNIIGGSFKDGNIIKSNWLGIFLGENGSQNSEIVGNVISNNHVYGIGLENNVSFGNLFSQNMIFDNGDLGIDLKMDGITLNDQGDLDEGPNGLINFPIIEKINLTNGRLVIQGYVDFHSKEKLKIEFYSNNGSDLTGYGEGEIYLGSTTTNPHGKFTVTFPPIKSGLYVTALAIDTNNNTSEFSKAYLVQ